MIEDGSALALQLMSQQESPGSSAKVADLAEKTADWLLNPSAEISMLNDFDIDADFGAVENHSLPFLLTMGQEYQLKIHTSEKCYLALFAFTSQPNDRQDPKFRLVNKGAGVNYLNEFDVDIRLESVTSGDRDEVLWCVATSRPLQAQAFAQRVEAMLATRPLEFSITGSQREIETVEKVLATLRVSELKIPFRVQGEGKE